LDPFRWQLCRGHTTAAIKAWLKSGEFPDEVPSSDVILRLFAGSIGTKDPAAIRAIIDPTAPRRSIDVRIFWPDSPPPPSITVRRQYVSEQPQVLQLIRR
jgi:hypothetical protein